MGRQGVFGCCSWTFGSDASAPALDPSSRVFILPSAGTGCFPDHIQRDRALDRAELISPLCNDPSQRSGTPAN